MTGVEAEPHWSDQAVTLCRLYQSLQPAISELPETELTALSRQIATDLVFLMSTVQDTEANVDDALASISAVCQSCLFERTVIATSP
jgi:hypothetical protein